MGENASHDLSWGWPGNTPPHAMEGDRAVAQAAGCDDYDTKPVELPRLLGKMRSLLGSRA